MQQNEDLKQTNSQHHRNNSNIEEIKQEQTADQLQKGAKFHKPLYCQEECQFERIYAVRQSKSMKYAEIIAGIFTCGLSVIASYWRPQWRFKWFFSNVAPEESEAVFVFGYDGTVTFLKYLKDIKKHKKVFEYRFQRYYLQESDKAFASFSNSAFDCTNQQIIEMASTHEFTVEKQHDSYDRNGKNHTDVQDKGFLFSALYELFSPFYFFQVGSCILWLYEEYLYYAYVIIAVASLGFITKIVTERLNFLRLQKLSILRKEVIVQRKGARFEIPSDEVIFGDIVYLNKGETANCDLIVIQGSAIVNESMLTGDSLPFAKSAIALNNDQFQEDRSYVIFSGSVILSQSKLKCVVFRLGFNTLRGNMIRSILFPKKLLATSFNTDTIYFILIMGGAALISFFVTLSTFIDKFNNHLIQGKDIVIRCLDLVTISVPPALPTCLNFGISFSMLRLKIQNIFCLNSENLSTCGIVRTLCFDKTGTLTENTLTYKMISGFNTDNGQFRDVEGPESYRQLTLIQRVIIGACHSLRVMEGTIKGDPLDIEMFNNSGCEISKKSGEQLQWEGYGVIQEIILKEDLNSIQSEKGLLNEPEIKKGKEAAENEQNMHEPISSHQLSPQKDENQEFIPNLDFQSKENMSQAKDNYFEINLPIEKLQQTEPNNHSKHAYEACIDGPASTKANSYFPLNAKRIDILKIFPFESKYERMSTLIRIDGNTYIITKGSPEKMKTISSPDTLPNSEGNLNETFEGKLSSFTKQGLRVIAMGYKQIDAYDIGKPRKKLESDLIFIGFLAFENQLKPSTVLHLQLLKESEIQLSMVTGDNAQTSLSIGRQCEIFTEKDQAPILLDYVDNQITTEQDDLIKNYEDLEELMKNCKEEFVVTGQFFERFFTPDETKSNLNQIRHLLFKTRVFARMKPDQKQGLVRLLQEHASENGRTFIGLCGDGANDCQALKCADMGISLGESEASVAASFTSKVLNIGIIEKILREGRCCIVTQFQCFKFMALYSSIQVSTTAIMYYRGVTPSNYQFLYWDLFIVLPLAFFLGITASSKKLALSLPAHRLFSATNVISVVGLGIIQLCFQIIAVAATSGQSWYIDPITYQTLSGLDKSELLMNSFDNSVIFWTSNFQYLGVLVSFSLFSVHKRPFYTNIIFTAYLLCIIVLSVFLQFTTSSDVNDLFELQPQLTTVEDGTLITEMEYGWRFAILGIILGNLIAIFAFECYLRDKIVRKLEERFPSLVYKGAATSNFIEKAVIIDEVQNAPLIPSQEIISEI